MGYVADFDPTGFDQSDPLTWPAPAPYSPTDWWYVTAPGTINAIPVDVGDRVYPFGVGRTYGADTYGSGVYGGEAPDPPWSADPTVVRWRGAAWTSAPAWQRPPAPGSGAPFGDTGWRITVEVYTLVDGARLYGSGTYGSGVYGDDIMGPALDWRDVACHVAGAAITRGVRDGAPVVDVDQMTIDLVDVDGSVLPIDTTSDYVDGIFRGAGVDTPIRVALIDPAGEPHPLFTGRIEMMADDAERPPRVVTVEAYGMVADMATVANVNRPSETATARIAYLARAAAYSWGIELPAAGATLRRTDLQVAANVREILDSTALSAGLHMRSDPTGVIVFPAWPLPATVPAVGVTDRKGAADLAASRIEWVGDAGELLNVVDVESEEVQGSPALTATRRDDQSVGRYGSRPSAFGFPLTGLSAGQVALGELADAALARYSRIVNRVTAIGADTGTDPRWLAVLAELDAGQSIDVTSTKPTDRAVSAIVVGFTLNVLPGRISADVYLSTTTEMS